LKFEAPPPGAPKPDIALVVDTSRPASTDAGPLRDSTGLLDRVQVSAKQKWEQKLKREQWRYVT
jgi:hypothetical protein